MAEQFFSSCTYLYVKLAKSKMAPRHISTGPKNELPQNIKFQLLDEEVLWTTDPIVVPLLSAQKENVPLVQPAGLQCDKQ